jgi:hypothetical protein
VIGKAYINLAMDDEDITKLGISPPTCQVMLTPFSLGKLINTDRLPKSRITVLEIVDDRVYHPFGPYMRLARGVTRSRRDGSEVANSTSWEPQFDG